MTGDTHSRGEGPEFPSAEKLRVYGDVMFLCLRSEHHAQMSVANLRAAMEPPIELGQFRIFRFDGIPRGMFTWAHLGAEAETRLVSGQALLPEDWNSGGRLWLIDLIAPYPGMTAAMARWVMTRGNLTDGEFLFRRVKNGRETRRIVHVDFRWTDSKARMLTNADFGVG